MNYLVKDFLKFCFLEQYKNTTVEYYSGYTGLVNTFIGKKKVLFPQNNDIQGIFNLCDDFVTYDGIDPDCEGNIVSYTLEEDKIQDSLKFKNWARNKNAELDREIQELSKKLDIVEQIKEDLNKLY